MKLNNETLRLYAVTDRRWLNGRSLLDQLEEALAGGVTMVQLREKELDEAAFLREAIEVRRLCHRFGVPLLINDSVEIAMRSEADGVHVGQQDMEAGAARRLVGSGMIVGVTAKTVAQAQLAQVAGADYLGSGAVFSSATKADARPMTLGLLREICEAVSVPVVAIGGLNRDNILDLTGTGVSGAAVVSGIFAAGDITAECRLLRQLIEKAL